MDNFACSFSCARQYTCMRFNSTPAMSSNEGAFGGRMGKVWILMKTHTYRKLTQCLLSSSGKLLRISDK